MSNEITYQNIKGQDISVAMASSVQTTNASEKAKNQGAIVWNHTVALIMDEVDFSAVVPNTGKDEIEALRVELADFMGDHITSMLGTLPESGKGRNGKDDIKLAKTDGTIKWSSWNQTKVIFGYLGDIARIVMFEKTDVLYPEQNKIGARNKVLQLCKVQASAMDNIKRLHGELQDNLDQVAEPVEILESHRLVSSLMVNNLDITVEMNSLLDQFDALLAVADSSEKVAVQAKLLAIANKRF